MRHTVQTAPVEINSDPNGCYSKNIQVASSQPLKHTVMRQPLARHRRVERPKEFGDITMQRLGETLKKIGRIGRASSLNATDAVAAHGSVKSKVFLRQAASLPNLFDAFTYYS